jgi:hypothetical protein
MSTNRTTLSQEIKRQRAELKNRDGDDTLGDASLATFSSIVPVVPQSEVVTPRTPALKRASANVSNRSSESSMPTPRAGSARKVVTPLRSNSRALSMPSIEQSLQIMEHPGNGTKRVLLEHVKSSNERLIRINCEQQEESIPAFRDYATGKESCGPIHVVDCCKQEEQEHDDSTVDYTLGSKVNITDEELMNDRAASPGQIRLTEEGLAQHTEKKRRDEAKSLRNPRGFEGWRRRYENRKLNRVKQDVEQLESRMAKSQSDGKLVQAKNEGNRQTKSAGTLLCSREEEPVQEDEAQEFERIQKRREAYLKKERELEAQARRDRIKVQTMVISEDSSSSNGVVEGSSVVDCCKSASKEDPSTATSGEETTFTVSTTASHQPCAICEHGERTHIAMPCMHYSFCEECVEAMQARGVQVCPICNAARVSFTKVFF